MATATRPKPPATTQTLAKPMVCKKCSATHFSYQLTCKRCGDYMDKRDAVVSESNVGAVKLAVGATVLLVSIMAACLVFHIH